jgi:tungstate transport system ATP-binding protein
VSALYRLQGVEQSYGDPWRLEIPELEIETGDFLTIIGPTGAGKSTLLRLLHLLDAPAAGRIEFAGEPVAYPAPLGLRRQIGMVFQRPLMFSGSVRRNIDLGLRFRGARDETWIQRLLTEFDLEPLADREARLVSGGEMQRVAVARALAYQPRVLLLDEPAASLDPGHLRAIEGIIRAAHGGRKMTIVAATHNLGQARRLSTRVAMMSGGRLLEIQETEAFFTRPREAETAAYLSTELGLEITVPS